MCVCVCDKVLPGDTRGRSTTCHQWSTHVTCQLDTRNAPLLTDVLLLIDSDARSGDYDDDDDDLVSWRDVGAQSV